jgi:2-polyprenyl-6-methoxyphenol hydroxylase-like FAD-dependent oxidoreductase
MTVSAVANGNKPSHRVIVGGSLGDSLGGLFAGVSLKWHGINTTILERKPTNLLDDQGAGIVAGGDTLTFSEKYDRTGRDVAVPSHKRMYLNQKGETGEWNTGWQHN